jgi:alkylhydroperoxidase family enzyme
VKATQSGVTAAFRSAHRRAMRCYTAGRWEEAREALLCLPPLAPRLHLLALSRALAAGVCTLEQAVSMLPSEGDGVAAAGAPASRAPPALVAACALDAGSRALWAAMEAHGWAAPAGWMGRRRVDGDSLQEVD